MKLWPTFRATLGAELAKEKQMATEAQLELPLVPKGTMHRLEVRQKEQPGNPKRLMTGAGTEVLLDGLPLKGVAGLTFEVAAKGVAKVFLEMYADVSIDAVVETHKTEADEAGTHELGNMYPRALRQGAVADDGVEDEDGESKID